MTDLLDKFGPLRTRLVGFDNGGARPFDTTFNASRGPCEVELDGRRTLMFGSNNYLGLTHHPEVLAAARDALERFGSGTTGSRGANGSLALHTALERDLVAAFSAAEPRIRYGRIFTTGHQANLSLVAGLCGPDDTLLLDAESHASIWDGAKLAGSTLLAFRHNSASDLARKLARLPPGDKNTLVVVEGLYSVRGDVAPLSEIAEVCRAAGSYLMVDEAHSFGTFGPRGLGCAEAQEVLGDVDFLVGTFSKSLAGIGGFAVSRYEEVSLLQFVARAYIYTASGSPANLAGVGAALSIMQREPERRQRLWTVIRRMRAGLIALGYSIGEVESPIVPIYIGRPDATLGLWRALLAEGLYVNIALPPACPPERCLLRTSCTAVTTDEHLDEALDIYGRVGRRLGVIQKGI